MRSLTLFLAGSLGCLEYIAARFDYKSGLRWFVYLQASPEIDCGGFFGSSSHSLAVLRPERWSSWNQPRKMLGVRVAVALSRDRYVSLIKNIPTPI